MSYTDLNFTSIEELQSLTSCQVSAARALYYMIAENDRPTIEVWEADQTATYTYSDYLAEKDLLDDVIDPGVGGDQYWALAAKKERALAKYSQFARLTQWASDAERLLRRKGVKLDDPRSLAGRNKIDVYGIRVTEWPNQDSYILWLLELQLVWAACREHGVEFFPRHDGVAFSEATTRRIVNSARRALDVATGKACQKKAAVVQ